MDPNENLKEQIKLATRITETHDAGETPKFADVDRLAELVLALNDWLSVGGFMPDRWTR